jgi:TRAP-type mannitol/chloroaromatic compound transport system permease small subunit
VVSPGRQPDPVTPVLGHTPAPAGLVDALNERLGRAVSWLTLLMVGVTFLVVVLRYVFDLGWIAMQESVTYMHAVVFMLGAAFTLKHHGHVRVDIVYRRLGRRGRAWVDLFGGLLLLLPMCLFIAWISWDYVAASWGVTEGSREAGGLPGVFLLKTLILIMPVLLALQALAGVLRDVLFLVGRDAADSGPDEIEV